jgi:hypothetical protein
MNKYVIATLFTLISASAIAQDSPKQLLSGMRPLCAKVVDKDMIRDMTKFSNEPLNSEKVCDCATERLSEDPVFKKVAGLNSEQRRALPKAQQVSVYLSAKFYSASLSCYADAIRTSADHIDIGH